MTKYSVNVLLKTWTSEIFIGVLDQIIPNREETADEFEFPQFSDQPEFLTNSSLEAVKKIEGTMGESYQISWGNVMNSSPEMVTAYFLKDGGLALTLNILADLPIDALKRVVSKFDCEYAFISYVFDPFSERSDFVKRCIGAPRPKIVDKKAEL